MSLILKEYVEVHNLDENVYEEEWKEQQISIPAGGFIKMESTAAAHFMGVHPGMDRKTGTYKVKALKRVRIKADAELVEDGVFKSPKTGEVFQTKEAYDAHLKTLEGEVIKDPELDKAIEKQKTDVKKDVGTLECPVCHQKGIRGVFGLEMHLKKHKE